MSKKGNIICVILIVIVATAFGVFKHFDNQKSQIAAQNFEQMRQEYLQQVKIEQQEKEEQQAKYDAIREDIPGIVCWGDDMTYGKGGIEKCYPRVLEYLLTDNEYQLPVLNNGVTGEDSLTVFGRMGAIPYVVENGFSLKSAQDLVEVDVVSSFNGESVKPLLRKRNPGVNPCSINGIKGTLFGYVNSADLSKIDSFYFYRDNSGDSVHIDDGAEVVTDGNNYKDYINIVSVGENGGWKDNDELVEQYNRFVEYLKGTKNENSYLILGMTKGDKQSNTDLENMMSEQFGTHYINTREYLSTTAVSDLDIDVSDEDKKAMDKGEVPPCLKDSEGNLNDKAYEAIGRLVYNKLVEYNYIKK